jgi:hypothetical protein
MGAGRKGDRRCRDREGVMEREKNTDGVIERKNGKRHINCPRTYPIFLGGRKASWVSWETKKRGEAGGQGAPRST